MIEPVGEARTNADVFSELAERLGVGQAEDETETLMRITARMKDGVGAEVVERGVATPPHGGTPIQFVDVFPLTPDRKVDLVPGGHRRRRAGGSLRLPAGSGDRRASRSR